MLRRFLAIALLLGGCKHKAPPAAEPARAEEPPPPVVAKPAPSNPPGALRVRLAVVDQTSEDERPVALEADLLDMAGEAARRAGLAPDDDGALAGIEVHYGLFVDGKPAPRAEKGLLTWAAQVSLRVEDGGLGEDLTSVSRSESPYVRGAAPDLRKVLREVLGVAMEQALRDAAAQAKFRSLGAAEALAALDSEHAEERWAAMRRLADLRHTEAIPKIAAFLEDEDDLTVDVAVAALGQIRDERAVEPLARAAEGPNVDRALAVVEALAAIGGAKARKYLDLIGASHPSERVRDRVKELQSAD